jgi:Cu-Zn family superoxide dismutase
MSMKMMRWCVGFIFLVMTTLAHAIVIPIYMTAPGDTENGGKKLGTVTAEDTIYGLLLTPKLHGLPPGIHGFHIHDMPFCGNNGTAAGNHLDPQQTKKHKGPYSGEGHLGDLPVLIVDAKGNATLPVLAPRLKLEQVKGRSLMIHAGGDNYSDLPEKLGGGGMRLACGVINYH